MAKYLVTGAAGFIGSKVSEMLLEDGHSVVGVDNLNDAYDVRLKEFRLKRLQQMKGFDFARQDICDYPALEKLAEKQGKMDGIINLAARAGVRYSVINPWAYLAANTEGALNLLELCRHYDIPKYVQASTSSIYGNNAPLPTPEDADSSHPLQPYAASKKGAEAMAYSYHYLYGIDVTVFRYFTVYGPAGRPDMVMFRFAKWIAEGEEVHLNGDGTQTRGFTYLDDIARGTILGLKPLGYEIINLGGHQNISINELIAVLEDLIGRKANIVYHDQHKADAKANQALVDKARKMLGWDPQVTLEEGIPNMVNWYMENREWARDIKLT